MIKKKINLGFVTATIMMAAVSLSGCADSNMRSQKNTIVNQEETETQELVLEEMTDFKESIPETKDFIEETTIEQMTIEETQSEYDAQEDKILEICEWEAYHIVDVELLTDNEIDQLFYAVEIPPQVQQRIMGCSYIENEDIALEELSYVRVLHIGFDGKAHIGELIVNNAISQDIVSIMKALYDAQYPIERMVLIEEYGGDDDKSMEANTTSAFNYRLISGTNKLSNHSFGRAIDINPLYNPYVRTASDGSIRCDPAGGAEYVDRTKDFLYKIDQNDLCYQLFIEHGFTWGGNWKTKKDYQHFEKVQNA